jgi:hypothetical protein
MNFLITAYLPTLKKEIYIDKISFGDYLQLNLYIESNDLYNISNQFEKICEKAFKNSNQLSNLDKFSILLHLYAHYFNAILKISGKNTEDEPLTFEVFIKNIINEIKKYKTEDIILPKNIFYKNTNDILKETSQDINKIKTHINENKILMFFIPDFIKGIPKVYINCFDNSLFHFLKFLYSEKPEKIYKKIKNLKKHNFFLSEIYDISPKEVDMFLSNK